MYKGVGVGWAFKVVCGIIREDFTEEMHDLGFEG